MSSAQPTLSSGGNANIRKDSDTLSRVLGPVVVDGVIQLDTVWTFVRGQCARLTRFTPRARACVPPGLLPQGVVRMVIQEYTG